MRRQLLDFQADRIEAVLARHKVQARVIGGRVAPRWIQFEVLPALGARINKVKGLADELALALDCDSCRITRQGGVLLLQIPRSDPQPVRLLPLHRRLSKTDHNMPRSGGSIDSMGPMDAAGSMGASQRHSSKRTTRPVPFGSAVLGLAEDGAPLLVRLPSPQVAHILIAGTTGSGKSALAQTIITSLALNHRPSQLGLILIDPKCRAFGRFSNLPHLLRPVLSQPEDIVAMLEMLVTLMLTRDAEGRIPVGENTPGEARVVVVIDEVADLLMVTGKATQQAITRLSQRGREAGIHLVVCTQKPASQILGSLVKANFPLRLVGRVTSPEDAKVATGYGGTGAEKLRGPGDFVAVSGGQIRRFQAAYTSPRDIAGLFERPHARNGGSEGQSRTGWAEVTPTDPPRHPPKWRLLQLLPGQNNSPGGHSTPRSLSFGFGDTLRPTARAEMV